MKKIVILIVFFLPLLTSAAMPKYSLWQPEGDYGPSPLIVFSHGFSGCSTQSLFITQELARRGYVVAAPNHADGVACPGDDKNFGDLTRVRQQKFRDPEVWTDETYVDRRNDVVATLDEMLRLNKTAGSVLYQKIDESKIGLMGHSLGGYTVLGIAGARDSWYDARVKAVLALSPYIKPYLTGGNLKKLKVPVMYQGGTRDFTVTPLLDEALAQSPGQKYFVNIRDSGHFAWTDFNRSAKEREEISANTVAFFDRHLKNLNVSFPKPRLTWWQKFLALWNH